MGPRVTGVRSGPPTGAGSSTCRTGVAARTCGSSDSRRTGRRGRPQPRHGGRRDARRGLLAGRTEAGLLPRTAGRQRVACPHPAGSRGRLGGCRATDGRRGVRHDDRAAPGWRTTDLSSDRGGGADLWMATVGGREMVQLTTDREPDQAAQVSPDGRHIAFHSYRRSNYDIWVLPLDGGPAHQVTSDPRSEMFPAWSPDGGQLAFYAERDNAVNVFVMPAAGGESHQITKGPVSSTFLSGRWMDNGFTTRRRGRTGVTSTVCPRREVRGADHEGGRVLLSVVAGPDAHLPAGELPRQQRFMVADAVERQGEADDAILREEWKPPATLPGRRQHTSLLHLAPRCWRHRVMDVVSDGER